MTDFRRATREGIRDVGSRFVVLWRKLTLFRQAVVTIDGSKFKVVNA